jgi:hypothetical protein
MRCCMDLPYVWRVSAGFSCPRPGNAPTAATRIGRFLFFFFLGVRFFFFGFFFLWVFFIFSSLNIFLLPSVLFGIPSGVVNPGQTTTQTSSNFHHDPLCNNLLRMEGDMHRHPFSHPPPCRHWYDDGSTDAHMWYSPAPIFFGATEPAQRRAAEEGSDHDRIADTICKAVEIAINSQSLWCQKIQTHIDDASHRHEALVSELHAKQMAAIGDRLRALEAEVASLRHQPRRADFSETAHTREEDDARFDSDADERRNEPPKPSKKRKAETVTAEEAARRAPVETETKKARADDGKGCVHHARHITGIGQIRMTEDGLCYLPDVFNRYAAAQKKDGHPGAQEARIMRALQRLLDARDNDNDNGDVVAGAFVRTPYDRCRFGDPKKIASILTLRCAKNRFRSPEKRENQEACFGFIDAWCREFEVSLQQAVAPLRAFRSVMVKGWGELLDELRTSVSYWRVA